MKDCLIYTTPITNIPIPVKLKVRKHRNGTVGVDLVSFNLETYRWEPFVHMTRSIPGETLEQDEAYIDTFFTGDIELAGWAEKNGIATGTGEYGKLKAASFPKVRLNRATIQQYLL